MRKIRKTYDDEFKINLVREFQCRKIEISTFATEKNISESTFKKWLEIYRLAETLKEEKKAITKSGILIDVTKEAKEIIDESTSNENQKIDFEINGIKLTFSLKNLKIVLEMLQNGWS